MMPRRGDCLLARTQDAAKDSDDNVLLQIRMLEDELHRKKIQWSKLRHNNSAITDDISESRLRKTKCAKVRSGWCRV